MLVEVEWSDRNRVASDEPAVGANKSDRRRVAEIERGPNLEHEAPRDDGHHDPQERAVAG
jgi:hypothetical protein